MSRPKESSPLDPIPGTNEKIWGQKLISEIHDAGSKISGYLDQNGRETGIYHTVNYSGVPTNRNFLGTDQEDRIGNHHGAARIVSPFLSGQLYVAWYPSRGPQPPSLGSAPGVRATEKNLMKYLFEGCQHLLYIHPDKIVLDHQVATEPEMIGGIHWFIKQVSKQFFNVSGSTH